MQTNASQPVTLQYVHTRAQKRFKCNRKARPTKCVLTTMKAIIKWVHNKAGHTIPHVDRQEGNKYDTTTMTAEL